MTKDLPINTNEQFLGWLCIIFENLFDLVLDDERCVLQNDQLYPDINCAAEKIFKATLDLVEVDGTYSYNKADSLYYLGRQSRYLESCE